jgi:ferredoxin
VSTGLRYLEGVTTLQLDASRCTGCGACTEVCPHAVFVVEEHRARILDRDACMECGACVTNCAADALSVDAGVGCASAIINSWIFGGEPSCGCADDETGAASGGCC